MSQARQPWAAPALDILWLRYLLLAIGAVVVPCRLISARFLQQSASNPSRQSTAVAACCLLPASRLPIMLTCAWRLGAATGRRHTIASKQREHFFICLSVFLHPRQACAAAGGWHCACLARCHHPAAGMYNAMAFLLSLSTLSCLHTGLDLAMPFNQPFRSTSLSGAS